MWCQEPGSYEHLDKITGKLINGILDAAKEAGHEVRQGWGGRMGEVHRAAVSCCGFLFSFFWTMLFMHSASPLLARLGPACV